MTAFSKSIDPTIRLIKAAVPSSMIFSYGPRRLTLISQPLSLSYHLTLHHSSLLFSAFRLLPASVQIMSVLSLNPDYCPVTQHLLFSVPPHCPPMLSILLLAALSNLVPILSIISLIPISLFLLMLLPLPLNLSLVLWLTPFLQLVPFLLV